MVTKYHNAHEVTKDERYPHGTQVGGPYLDEIRAVEEEQRRKAKAEKFKIQADLENGKNRKEFDSAVALQTANDLIEREAALEVDKKILKDDNQIKTSDAHNPKVVGSVPRGASDYPQAKKTTAKRVAKKAMKKPVAPKKKSKTPVERASVPPVEKETLNKKEQAVVKRAQKKAARVTPKKSTESLPKVESQVKVASAKKSPGKK